MARRDDPFSANPLEMRVFLATLWGCGSFVDYLIDLIADHASSGATKDTLSFLVYRSLLNAAVYWTGELDIEIYELVTSRWDDVHLLNRMTSYPHDFEIPHFTPTTGFSVCDDPDTHAAYCLPWVRSRVLPRILSIAIHILDLAAPCPPLDDVLCGICLEDLVSLTQTCLRMRSCIHVFHRSCLSKWLDLSHRSCKELRCPYCRTLLTALPPN
jgi:hypothetical protein